MMMQRTTIGMVVATIVGVATGCNSGGDSKGDPGNAAYWAEWCDKLDCDASDPAWQDGLINGHRVRAVEKCAPDTEFPGDDQALCAPNEGEGFQLHFGPSSYDDADEVARFVAAPREEIEECQYIQMPNTENAYINQFSGTMRPQSHHMILWGPVGGDEPPELSLSDCNQAAGLESGFLLGSQTSTISLPDLNAPMVADEDRTVNLIEPNMIVALDLHYVNRTADPVLRESWVNLYTTELSDDVKVLNPIFLVGAGINVAPMSTGTTFSYECPAPADMRINLLTGHHHENSPRFSIWIQRAGSTERELVYENLDALDPYMATYTANYELPTPDRDNGISGGLGGELVLQKGDKLHWECVFDNPTNNTVRLGELSTDQMCNVFGSFITDSDIGTWNAASPGGALCLSSDILGNMGL